METYTFEDIKNKVYGAKGTSRRDNIEKELATLQVGLQIRNARKALHMTQSPNQAHLSNIVVCSIYSVLITIYLQL